MVSDRPASRSVASTLRAIARPTARRLLVNTIRSSLLCASLCCAGAAIEATENEAVAPTDRYVLPSLNGPIVAERVLAGLSQPVAIEFLPDGKALILQRDRGLMSIADFDAGSKVDVTGMPDMLVLEAAGAHDVELHPQYRENGWIYVAYSEGEPYRSTAVVDRVRLEGSRVAARERVFSADAYSEGLYHFAARIAFVDGYLFLALGDREHPPMAQDNSNHAGTIVRLHDDGRVPADNPFVGATAAEGAKPPRPEIWSFGHRDPQGLYRHPETGELWSHEHGPRGGDELNRVKKGANYGWPVVSYGFQYDGGPIGMGIPAQEGMEVPAWVYVPSIAPSDLVIYQGAAFPAWQGNFLIGSMVQTHFNRLVMRDGEIVAEERLALRLLGRIRAVAVDPAGLVYLGSDNGEIWRLRPQ
jgi:glucose/arabinose dehydrogenase